MYVASGVLMWSLLGAMPDNAMEDEDDTALVTVSSYTSARLQRPAPRWLDQHELQPQWSHMGPPMMLGSNHAPLYDDDYGV
jgi:hypothetical protein